MARLIRPDRTVRRVLVSALAMLLWPVAACSVGPGSSTSSSPAISGQSEPSGTLQSTSVQPATAGPSPSTSTPAARTDEAASPTAQVTPSPVRQGADAHSAGVRFVPGVIELSSGNSAVVEPEQTVDGALAVPTDIRRVGWWDGSAYAGDPFGSTVIAGHVDSKQQGLGFFAELLLIQVGDLVTVRSGDTQALTYRVVSTTLIDKDALASGSQALDQRGPHRLVLITCSGQWHADVRSYDSNLVVVADPVLP